MTTHLPPDAGPEADLLQPLDGDSPCGPDLEYDPGFVILLANVATRRDAQYGDFVDAATPINWGEAERDCRALLARSKDLRLLVILARCRVRQAGAPGLRVSLELIDAMLRRYADGLNPVPTLDGEHDPMIFANALGALADPDGLIADVRDIAMPKSMGTPLQLRDIERALAKTRSKDALTPEAAARLVADLHDRRDAAAQALAGAAGALARINAWTSDTFGAMAPDLALLTRLLEPFQTPGPVHEHSMAAATPLAQAQASPDKPPPPTKPAKGRAPPPAETPRPIPAYTRWDMLETLRTARVWFETHEPSSPVSVLIKQAERMVGRRYSELHRMVPAELLEQWDAPQD
ncbi:ImpA family type VI secretion system protein [Achromobacter arsenitoxydans]|uniref:ImpA N-terminal domain-containing protein n=1 Tax=Achromobacter arsenitoxydans SY8 TaxID=477184 RepID=H0FER1_9BURK|nr:type VI secretion system ImpA family N-terminal domain-containing protein [Achromobacter arsenitoxydans]EHK63212.1 hypothetical protein KYC_26377 [Achromobacter arsenitoxydans SY8]